LKKGVSTTVAVTFRRSNSTVCSSSSRLPAAPCGASTEARTMYFLRIGDQAVVAGADDDGVVA